MALINFGKKKKEPMTVATFDKEEFEKQEKMEKELKESRQRLQTQGGFGILDNFDIANNLEDDQTTGLSELELRLLRGEDNFKP